MIIEILIYMVFIGAAAACAWKCNAIRFGFGVFLILWCASVLTGVWAFSATGLVPDAGSPIGLAFWTRVVSILWLIGIVVGGGTYAYLDDIKPRRRRRKMQEHPASQYEMHGATETDKFRNALKVSAQAHAFFESSARPEDMQGLAAHLYIQQVMNNMDSMDIGRLMGMVRDFNELRIMILQHGAAGRSPEDAAGELTLFVRQN